MTPERRPTVHQFVRFLSAGAVNTAFGYSVYAMGIFVGVVPETALLLTIVIGVVFNYLTTSQFVFSIRPGVFPRFALAYALIYVINVMALRGLLSLGVGPLLSQAIALPPVVICTFVILKLLVYRS